MFNFIGNNFVRLYCDSCHIGMHLKKLIKIVEFLCSHFNIEDGRKYATFWHIMLFYFKKSKNTTETQKYLCTVWRGAVTDRMCQKWFAEFHVGDFLLDDVHGWVDQLKLTAIKLRH